MPLSFSCHLFYDDFYGTADVIFHRAVLNNGSHNYLHKSAFEITIIKQKYEDRLQRIFSNSCMRSEYSSFVAIIGHIGQICKFF